MTQWVIERLGHRGNGMAVREDGARALAPLTLPGEVIEGEAVPAASGLARIERPRIMTPSPMRVSAACKHYKTCGGCSLMHATDAFVSEWKTGTVEQALQAQGINVKAQGIAVSPPRSRRRAVLAGRRLRSGAVVGLHAKASDQLVAMEDCLVIRPAIMQAMPMLRELVAAGVSRGQEVTLTVTETETGLDVSATGGKSADPALMGQLADLAGKAGWARLSWEGEALTRQPVSLTMGKARVQPPPAAFLQATKEGEAALQAVVLAGTEGAARVADLYCGIGTFSLPLAARAEVHAVEGLAAAVSALDAAWRATPDLRRVTTEVRDLARRPLMPDELARFDAVVVDPPRAGAQSQAEMLAQSAVKKLVWVSCDAVGFARDMRILLTGGYEIDSLRIVDQFRWSTHVEMIGILHKR